MRVKELKKENEALRDALRWLRDSCGVNIGTSIEKMLEPKPKEPGQEKKG